MNTTLTIRTDQSLREALEKRASALGITVSECVRHILQTELCERPISQRVGHLKGHLDLPDSASDPWRNQLRERNWRP